MPRTRSLAWAELKTGLLAIVAIVIATSFIFVVGGQGGFPWQVYRLKTRFPDVQGLKEGALVRLAGVEVGTVETVAFGGGADVEVEIELSKEMQSRVTTDSRAELGSLSLLGEPVIDLSAATTGTPLPDGAFIPSRRTTGQIKDVANSATATIEQLNDVIVGIKEGKGTVGQLVNNDALYKELQAFVGAASQVAGDLNRGQGTVGKLLQDPTLYRSLDASVNNLQTMLQRMNAGEGSIGKLIKDEAFSRSLTATTTNLETLSSRLNRGEGTAGKLLNETVLYDRLNSITTRLNDLMTKLNDGEGTVGRLLRDRELYENMNSTIGEFHQLIADVRKDPKKYLNVKVSIF